MPLRTISIFLHQGNPEIMAQERIDDWWEYAKELAKAERELQFERWVYISIEYKDEAGECQNSIFEKINF